MTTKYIFIAEDTDTKENVMVSLSTDTETWAAPTELFFRFLKAQGFLFHTDDYIGVMNMDTENFRGPDDEGGIS